MMLSTTALSIITACTLPIEVKKIDSVNAPANGIRYQLKRPGYAVGLRFTEKTFETISDEKAIEEQANVCFQDTEMDVLLEQNLEGDPLTYEVTTPNGFSAIPHILSDTNLTISTDPDATLRSISAGEDDRSLEFIQAVAGLALKAAAAAMGTEPYYCTLFKTDGFKNYAKNHLRLVLRKKNNNEVITRLLTSLTGKEGEAVAKILAAVESVRKEQSIVQEDLKKIRFNLKKEDFKLSVNEKKISDGNEWLTLKLVNQSSQPPK